MIAEVAGRCAGRECSGAAQLRAPPLSDGAVLSAPGSRTQAGRVLAEQLGRDRAVGDVHRGSVAADRGEPPARRGARVGGGDTAGLQRTVERERPCRQPHAQPTAGRRLVRQATARRANCAAAPPTIRLTSWRVRRPRSGSLVSRSRPVRTRLATRNTTRRITWSPTAPGRAAATVTGSHPHRPGRFLPGS